MSDLHVRLPAPCPESWDLMAPAGCNRHCASCDKIIHDLEQMTIGEVEALVAVSEDVCVRARIDGKGKVALKSNGWRGARRMIATVGAGVGLMAGSGVAMAKEARPQGMITGTVKYDWGGTHVKATDASGNAYNGKVNSRGKYKIKHLPPGTYTVTFYPVCSAPWEEINVVVEANSNGVKDTEDPNKCIIIGQLIVDEGSNGAG